MQLTEEQIKQFQRDGFTCIQRLIEPAVVQELRTLYDRFLRREIDSGTDDRPLGGIIRQVMHPHKHHSYFQDNPALTGGLHIGPQLLGEEVEFQFDMLISKPPGTTSETPWHQDWAYSEKPFAPAGKPIVNRYLQFWVALDDVDTQNGCIHFIPGRHEGGLLEHYIASGDPSDPSRLLATDEAAASKAIACPLPAGGCTIHTMGTPHFTGGNTTTNRDRRAYIFNLKAKEI